jgi:hypothetical protein
MIHTACCWLCLSLIFSSAPKCAERQTSELTATRADPANVSLRMAFSPKPERRRLSAAAAFSDESIAEAAKRLTKSPSHATAASVGSRRYVPFITAAAGAAIMAVAVSREEDFSAAGRAMWIGIGAGAGALVGLLISR